MLCRSSTEKSLFSQSMPKRIFSSRNRLQVAALVATEQLSDVYTLGARKPPICQLPQTPSPVISSLAALGKIEQVVPPEKRLYFYHVIAWLLVGRFMLLAVTISDSVIRAQDCHTLHHSTKKVLFIL